MKLRTSGVVARKLKSWCTGALLKTGQPMSDNVFEKICVCQDYQASSRHGAYGLSIQTAHAPSEKKNLSFLCWSISGALRDSGFQVHTKEASALETASWEVPRFRFTENIVTFDRAPGIAKHHLPLDVRYSFPASSQRVQTCLKGCFRRLLKPQPGWETSDAKHLSTRRKHKAQQSRSRQAS